MLTRSGSHRAKLKRNGKFIKWLSQRDNSCTTRSVHFNPFERYGISVCGGDGLKQELNIIYSIDCCNHCVLLLNDVSLAGERSCAQPHPSRFRNGNSIACAFAFYVSFMEMEWSLGICEVKSMSGFQLTFLHNDLCVRRTIRRMLDIKIGSKLHYLP